MSAAGLSAILGHLNRFLVPQRKPGSGVAARDGAQGDDGTSAPVRQEAALRATETALASSLDVRVVLSVLVDQTIGQLRADAADVLLLDASTQTLKYAAGRGFRTTAAPHHTLHLGTGHAGRAVLERTRVSVPNLRGQIDDPVRQRLFAEEKFRAYDAAPLIARGHVKGVLEVFHRAPAAREEPWFDLLEALAGQAAIAVDNAALFGELQRTNMQLTLAYDRTIEGWSRALDLRDKETEGHSERVAEMTVQLARALAVPEAEIIHVRRGALLHDIGKMALPDSMLFKQGPLTDEEWVIMRLHPIHAYELLAPIDYLRPAVDIPYCHHEKWDGTGYPRGLKGEQIPLAARIFAVVDVLDALRSDRSYRRAWTDARAREYLRTRSGTSFDPGVVKAILAHTEAAG